MVTVLATVCIIALSAAPSALADDTTGIELIARSKKEPLPERWSVVDSSGKEVAKVERQWGFAAVPPGKYQILLLTSDYQAIEVPLAAVEVVAGKTTKVEVTSGIDLTARSAKERPPEFWYVRDADGKKDMAKVNRRWGFTPLPPGKYQVSLLPDDYQALEILFATVEVLPGKATKVDVTSGVDFAPRAKNEPPPGFWYVRDPDGKKEFAKVHKRWGFTPLPPGKYQVFLLPDDYQALQVAFAAVEVAEGKASKVDVTSGIDLVARAKKERPPGFWYVRDADGQKEFAKVHKRFGFTPLPPGRYQVSLLPDDFQALELPWSVVEVSAGKVAQVDVKSGVDLQSRSEKDVPPEFWYVRDSKTKKDLAKVHKRWGFAPLPPGDYQISLLPQGYQAVEVPWSEITLTEGKTAAVEIKSGVELVAAKGAKPPEYWTVEDSKTRSQLAKVHQRFGSTPLPPGDYVVAKGTLRIRGVKVVEGELTKVADPDLATRLTYATGAGRKTMRELDPEGYKKLQEEVELAIRRGAAWLKKYSVIEEVPTDLSDTYATIGILALVHAGEFDRDPALANRCIEYLLRCPLNSSHGTYVTSLTAMSLRDLNRYRYRQRVLECAQWLIENQGWDDTHRVWSYGVKVPGIGDAKPAAVAAGKRPATKSPMPSGTVSGAGAAVRYRPGEKLEVVRRGSVAEPRNDWDLSNTQFAVLGLHSAALSDITLPRGAWERVEKHFRETQDEDGGWGYDRGSAYGSMTCAGIASLVAARHHLGAEKPTLDLGVVRGLEWLDSTFTVEENPKTHSNHYYYLYGLERVGVLAGAEFIGEHEWYPIGARYLVDHQKGDGSWSAENGAAFGSHPRYLDTCYAILFLRRATLALDPPEPSLLSVAYQKGRPPATLMPAVELILDSSGSMNELVEKRPKIQIAQAVMNDVLRDLPDEIQVGLRLYGHWGVWLARRDDPKAAALDINDPRLKKDSQLVVPIGPLDQQRRAKILKWVNWAQPRGWTPLVYSLLEAKNDFPAQLKAPKTVVLVSDGEETCGGKLEDVAAAYRGSDVGAVIHVVGFDIQGTEAQKQLQEIARLGGGRYYSARNSGELAGALRSAIESIGFEVSDESGARQVTRGVINGDPVELDPGKYRVSALGLTSEPLTITIAGGKEVALELDEAGKLTVARP